MLAGGGRGFKKLEPHLLRKKFQAPPGFDIASELLQLPPPPKRLGIRTFRPDTWCAVSAGKGSRDGGCAGRYGAAMVPQVVATASEVEQDCGIRFVVYGSSIPGR
jgi:hypothetical protein